MVTGMVQLPRSRSTLSQADTYGCAMQTWSRQTGASSSLHSSSAYVGRRYAAALFPLVALVQVPEPVLLVQEATAVMQAGTSIHRALQLEVTEEVGLW